MKRKKLTCPTCKRIFTVAANRKRKYCSKHCRYSSNKYTGRNSKKYKTWRKKVYLRDNYTCQICGKVGGRLNADHIKPWALFPELRFDVNNGRTLCEECHKKTDTYGIKFSDHGIKREDFE